MRHTVTRREILRAAARGAALAPFLTLAACGPEDAAEPVHELRGRIMGTTYRLRVRAAQHAVDPLRLHEVAARVLRDVDLRLSFWRRDAELARVNAAAQGQWVPVAPATREVVAAALAMHRGTGGAFDPTVGALVDAWGFGPSRAPRAVPPAEVLARLAGCVDASALETRPSPPAVRRTRADVRLDLSAIAQGHALDAVAAAFAAHGVEHALLELGGELRAVGRAATVRPWRVAVERPSEGGRDALCVVALEDAAIGTSGVYLTWFAQAGRRYGHVLDPRTGRPVAHDLVSVSVISDDATTADALATALLVLGPEDGWDLARGQGVAALFARQDGPVVRIESTPAFAARVVVGGGKA